METTIKAPLRERLNIRLFVFLALVSLPFIYFLYIFIDQTVSGGIKNHAGYAEVDLKSLGNFPFDDTHDTEAAIPAQFRELNGKKVLLEGVMWAGGSSAAEVKRFELVYSVQLCCFNGPPRVQERVYVTVPDSIKVRNYTYAGPIRVLGKLHVGVKKTDTGVTAAIYEMDVESVEPA